MLADAAEIASSLFPRMKGLLGRSALPKGQALVIASCNCVHTFFMRFPIDLIFLDKSNRAVKVIHSLKPFRITPAYLKAVLTIELPPGTLASTSTQEGDIISIE